MTTDDEVKKIFEEHKAAFDIKADIIEAIEGNSFGNIMAGFVMAYTEFLMNCCQSEEQAKEFCAEFGAKALLAIMAFSEEGLCTWNQKGTIQ